MPLSQCRGGTQARRRPLHWAPAALGVAATLCTLQALALQPSRPRVSFEREVAPILERHCLRCHADADRKGGFSLTSRADLFDKRVVLPGRSSAGRLLALVTAAPGDKPRMPKDGTPLAPSEVDLLRRWVDEGAAWPAGLTLKDRTRADRSWWSLRPLAAGEPPSPPGMPAAWRVSPIDRYVFAALQARGLRPSPHADRRSLIRRLSYDLTGLPPTPEELAAFLQDRAPAAYERLVERLLASPHYGEHWGRHWLDIVRFGESNGFERNVIIPNAWPFRDYVIRSFNEDKPFSRMVEEHLAGDVLAPGDPAVEVGTTFLVCGPYDNVGNQDAVQAAQIRADTLDDIIRATGEAFLGLTLGCARCHDHKFDPVEMRDYYALYATFAGVQHGSRVIADPETEKALDARRRPLDEARRRAESERARLERAILERAQRRADEYSREWVRDPVSRYGTEETFPPVTARWLRLVVAGRDDNPAARTGFRIDEFEVWTSPAPGQPARNVAAAAAGGKAEGRSRKAQDFDAAYGAALTIDGRFGDHWIAEEPRLTLTFARPERIERVLFSSDRPRALGQHPTTAFVSDYVIEVSLDGQSWTRVADSRHRRPVSPEHRRRRLLDRETTGDERTQLERLAEERDRAERALAQIPPPPSLWVGTHQQNDGPFRIFLGGSPQKPGPEVTPASLSTLADVAPAYSLPANSPHGERRLALARWLTAAENPLTPRVLANRLWHYHFGTGIVDTPGDFGVMGGRPTHPELLDWLAGQVRTGGWRLKRLHRLIVTSQAYRQSSAFRPEAARVDAASRYLWRFPPRRLSGEELRDTILSIAGRLDRRMGGPGFRLYDYLEDNVATYVPREKVGEETYRRAVYHQNARAARVDLLTDFDCPDNAFSASRRVYTTTPLQALTLLNHSFTLDMAAALAQRLRAEAGADPGAQAERAFALAFSRSPTPAERGETAEFIRKRGAEALARALLNANELLYVD